MLVTKMLLIIGLVILVFLPRLSALDTFRTPDEDRWLARSTGHVSDIIRGDTNNLFKSPTPGITTQWIGAPTVMHSSWQLRKLPLALVMSFGILALGYISSQLWGIHTGMLALLLLALNPLLIAHSRIFGTDGLLTIFLTASLLLALLWYKGEETRYLVASSIAAGLAILSKITAIVVVPFLIILYFLSIITTLQHNKPIPTFKTALYHCTLWLFVMTGTLIVLLPALVMDPVVIINNILGMFTNPGYTDLHTAPWYYYLETLIFYTTPVHLMTALLLAFYWRRLSKETLIHIIIFLTFISLFILGMSIGDKKGDRYILPAFVLFDIIAALAISKILNPINPLAKPNIRHPSAYYLPIITFISLLFLLIWQVIIVNQLHPYELAYINPITQPFFGNRRAGWGEGLDLAATYLNAKPNAKQLKVASFYPNEFGHYFVGETKPAHQHDEGVDYVIIYRAMLDRGANAWETDVVNQYRTQRPEKTISLSGVPYAWIYKK